MQDKEKTTHEAPNKSQPGEYHKFSRYHTARYPNYDSLTEMSIRRVDRGDDQGEHVQIEIWVTHYKGKARKAFMTHGYMQLNPEQAKNFVDALSNLQVTSRSNKL